MKNLRTPQQNRALHKYYQILADTLNDAGLDMRAILKEEVDIPWEVSGVEKYLWGKNGDTKQRYLFLLNRVRGSIEIEQLPTLEEIALAGVGRKVFLVFFKIVAEALNDAGADMKKTLPRSTKIEWNKDTVKEYLWRPIQKAQLLKESTTQMTTKEVDKVKDTLERHLGQKFGVDPINFPSIEDIIRQNEYEKRNK